MKILTQSIATVKPQTAAPVAWLVAADPDASIGVDLAARWGHEDATEGKRRGGAMFIMCSPEYHSYHAGYSAGLVLRQKLVGDVSRGALEECAWFEEIAGAQPANAGRAAAHVGGVGYATLPPEAQAACDAEQALMAEDVHQFEEWIGLYEFEHRMEGR